MNSRKMSNDLKIVHFEGTLYRADPNGFTIGYTAANNYKGAPIKYFTLNKSEINTYTKYDKPYKKTWETTNSLRLVDILHSKTRKSLEKLIGSESLKIAFPILYGNKVSRVSEENTRNHDDKVLKAICELGYDGYYMEKLSNNMDEYVFHSEVGLCKDAFDKLKLVDIEKTEVVPRAPNKTRKRKRTHNINRNINRNTLNNKKNKNRFRMFSLNSLNFD